MRITVNGKEESLETESILLPDLLRLKKVKQPEMVSVELNGGVLKQREIPATRVRDGDILEFLYFIGGGERRD